MKIRTIAEAEQALQAYVPAVATYTGDDLSLVRMWPMLNMVGNPHERLKVIHAAGTSGKTSTCYYISHCLIAAGNKVGLSVSPHVDSITERVQINGEPIAEKKFCDYLSEFLQIIETLGSQQPSYFELLTVFELWVFVKEQVDYVVLETGMGGLLDASNVVTRTDKICVITDIGFDHMQFLGNTLPAIAFQKAGIIHTGNAVFMLKQPEEVMAQIEKQSNAVQSQPIVLTDSPAPHDSYLPLFQRRNWRLAYAVCAYIAKRDQFSLAKYFDPSKVQIPGRMDIISLPDKSKLVTDGAHNEQKMAAFVDSFEQLFPGKKAAVLLALKKGKEYKPVINILNKIAHQLIVTTFSTSQDLPAVSQDPDIIAKYATSIGMNGVSVEIDNEVAYAQLLASDSDIKLVTGSFYMIGQIRAL